MPVCEPLRRLCTRGRNRAKMLRTGLVRACSTACRASGTRRMNIWKDFKGETGARSALLAAADEVNGGGSKTAMMEQGKTTVLPNHQRPELFDSGQGREGNELEGVYPAEESMDAFIKAQQEWSSVADTNAQLFGNDGAHHAPEEEAGQDKKCVSGGCCRCRGDELGRERVFAEGMLLVDGLEEAGSVSSAEAQNLRKMCTLMDGRVLVVLLAYRGCSQKVTAARLRELITA